MLTVSLLVTELVLLPCESRVTTDKNTNFKLLVKKRKFHKIDPLAFSLSLFIILKSIMANSF